MYKLVVLSLVAVAVAEPSGLLYGSPLTYSTTVLSPATTTISKSASSVVHPSPIFTSYASPLTYGHFIKKRSALFPFITPGAWFSATIAARSPVVHTVPLNAAGHLSIATTHFIKKRSAPLLAASTYITPTAYAAPLWSSYAATTPLLSSYYSSPIAYSTPLTHFIKKRSVPLLTTYLAPTAYSHQSRIDVINNHSPILNVASYHARTLPVLF